MDHYLQAASLVTVASAFWLGVLTSISPCPLATNIAAISFIGRQVEVPAGCSSPGSCTPWAAPLRTSPWACCWSQAFFRCPISPCSSIGT